MATTKNIPVSDTPVDFMFAMSILLDAERKARLNKKGS